MAPSVSTGKQKSFGWTIWKSRDRYWYQNQHLKIIFFNTLYMAFRINSRFNIIFQTRHFQPIN